MASNKAEAVKVVVRCRPLNSKETADGRQRIVDMDMNEGQIKVRNPKSDDREPPKSFTFDQVYDWNCTQMEIFDVTARPIIDSVMEGYNGTIFAYGQTGTGKSHTMEGREDPPELRGIIPNTFEYVFSQIAKERGTKYLVRASYLEIYNEDIRDLLSTKPQNKLELKETPDQGVYVKDLKQFVVKDVPEINTVLQVGKKNRSVGATQMNQDSSRSHSIFTITIEMTENFDAAAAAAAQAQGKDNSHIRVGKLNLVDLAGSERQSKTGATGERLKEGIKINLSLTALGNVISALVDGKSGHVPYRDSKLTRLLQDSLGGNTKTVMVANVGPADWNYDETLSTLRYANRAKNIQNKPKINEDPKDAMLREFQEEIKRLKAALEAKGTGGGGGGGAPGQVVERIVEVDNDVDAIREQLRKELEEKMKQDLSTEAMTKAKEEAEAAARSQLEAIVADSSKTEEQRRRAKEALKRQNEEMQQISKQLEAEAKEKEALEAKIKAMESKVLQGGVNLLEKVDELKKRSEDLKKEAQIRRRQEEEQRRRLQELELKQMDFSEKFGTLEEEVQVKSRQLKKLFEKYQAKKAEITDLQEQFQREREGLLEDYRILTQQIKLKNLIIACFIPPDYQDRIMQHCHWQDYEGTWNIDFLQYAGNAIRAHQELAVAQEANEQNGLLQAESEKLQGIYFAYQSMEDEFGGGQGGGANGGGAARPGSAQKRPSSATRRQSNSSGVSSATAGGRSSAKPGSRGSGGSDPTNIGSLRDSVSWGQDQEEDDAQRAVPKARGLVKDTVDPRLRKTVAR